MVLGKLPVPGRPIILISVRQGPTALAAGAGGLFGHFYSHLSILSSFYAGYYVIPSELLSVLSSVDPSVRPSVSG